MLFDLTPLEPLHLLRFLGSFIALYLLLGLAWRWRPGWLAAEHQRLPVYYAGGFLLLVVTFFSYWVLPTVSLAVGLVLAAMAVIIAGRLDESLPMPASRQLLWQFLIAGVAVLFGWTIPYVTNPFGSGVIHLDQAAAGLLIWPGSLLAIVWLMFMMNAMNWLDGADGLASAVSVAALFTLVGVSLLPSTQDDATLSLALIGAGAVSAFLIWNWPPARVFLGTTGSWFLGLFIGMVAMIGGGKIVTTLLVLALPVLDVLFVVIQRLLAGQAPWQADRRHLHHRLLGFGLSARQLALLAAGTTALFGAAALVLQTYQKILVFAGIAAMLGAGIVVLIRHQRKGSYPSVHEK